MYLEKVHIKNFRNFQNFSINFKDGLNIIVGENNIGKSNLLEAIRVALPSVQDKRTMLRPEDRHLDTNGIYANMPIEIDLYFSDLSEKEQSEFLEILNFNPHKQSMTSASIHYKWEWDEKANRSYQEFRGGLYPKTGYNGLPESTLHNLSITFLDALRDADRGLAPGRNSKVSALLNVIAQDEDKEKIKKIYEEANNHLEQTELIKQCEEVVADLLKSTIGDDLFRRDFAIRANENRFESIISSIRAVLFQIGSKPKGEFFEVSKNGLGFNNLIYMAVVLAQLEIIKKQDRCLMPLLMIEEPEAHLHPQLQILLCEFFKSNTNIQSLVTSHSPTMTSAVPISSLTSIHKNIEGKTAGISLSKVSLTATEESKLYRMIDITKATMFFAKGIIFVEGITEALLVPILARKSGFNLEKKGISVVPVFGVDFDTLVSIFHTNSINIPISIITDGDPHISGEKWAQKCPKDDLSTSTRFQVCDRVKKLVTKLDQMPNIGVFYSKVTLEYDLADAADENQNIMVQAWENCFTGQSQNLNSAKLASIENSDERTLLIWRAICYSGSTTSKGEFAHSLCNLLDKRNKENIEVANFTIPEYLLLAIKHAYNGVKID